MNTIDIIILILLLIGGLNGLRQGLLKALANFVGWIFALIVSAKYSYLLAPSMAVLSQDPVVQKIAAFAFVVLLIIVLTWVVTAILNGVLKSLKLGPLNRVAGGAFGSLKGLLIVLVTMQGLGPWVEHSPNWKQSKFIQTLLPYAPIATEMSKGVASEALQQMKSESSSVEKPAGSDAKVRSDHSTNNPFY